MKKTTSSKTSAPKRFTRTITLQPSNGRDTGGLLCNAVPRPAAVADFRSREEVRAFVEEMRAKGKISGPVIVPAPAKDWKARPVKRDGVSTGLVGGAAAGVPVGVVSQWMNVTPKLAAEWLQNNFVNRPLSEDTVIAYARDMMNGVWTRTHQGIAFNDLDALIDGQHRLHAVIRSGRTVPMMVTFGLPAKIEGAEMTTMDAVDRGKPRSVADQLKIQHGLKNGSAIAMVVKSIAALCSSERTRRLSVGQTLDIYRAFREPVDRVIEERPREHGLKSAGVLAGFAFAMAAVPEVAVAWDALRTGTAAGGSALAKLRDFLTSDEAKLLMRTNDRALAELVLEALRLDAAGKQVVTLELSQAGVIAFRGRQPERVEMVASMFRLA